MKNMIMLFIIKRVNYKYSITSDFISDFRILNPLASVCYSWIQGVFYSTTDQNYYKQSNRHKRELRKRMVLRFKMCYYVCWKQRNAYTQPIKVHFVNKFTSLSCHTQGIWQVTSDKNGIPAGIVTFTNTFIYEYCYTALFF